MSFYKAEALITGPERISNKMKPLLGPNITSAPKNVGVSLDGGLSLTQNIKKLLQACFQPMNTFKIRSNVSLWRKLRMLLNLSSMVIEMPNLVVWTLLRIQTTNQNKVFLMHCTTLIFTDTQSLSDVIWKYDSSHVRLHMVWGWRISLTSFLIMSLTLCFLLEKCSINTPLLSLVYLWPYMSQLHSVAITLLINSMIDSIPGVVVCFWASR